MNLNLDGIVSRYSSDTGEIIFEPSYPLRLPKMSPHKTSYLINVMQSDCICAYL